MGRIRILAIIGVGLIMVAGAQPVITAQSGSDLTLPAARQEVRYLGQIPPGEQAELFAPDVLIHEAHDAPHVSQDERWLLFSGMGTGITFYRLVDGRLAETPNPLGFEIPEVCNGIVISISEDRVYIREWKDGGEYLYYIDKTEEGWTPPKYLNLEDFNATWQFSVAANENIYYSAGKIMVSRYDSGAYTAAQPLKLEDDTELRGADPYISPNEDYLLCSINGNLHISYRLGSGKWSRPVNLGPNINSDQLDICPQITPNGKYLLFNSRRNGPDWVVFWVRADFIEELRPVD